MSAIYLHIPFCKRLCGYCDFFKSVKLQKLDAVVDAIKQELIDQRSFLGDGSKVKTIYFGGGTPSLLSAEQVESLLLLMAEHYDLSALEEVTLEANPDDIDFGYLAALRQIGVNRLSIGVQSFDEDLLKFMNRRHSAVQAMQSVKMAQEVGFDNITIDLIFGVDGFGHDVLRRSLDVALSLGVQHISAYHLTIEPATPFARRLAKGEFNQVDESVSQQEYLLLEQMLTSTGFEHYEVSNYAQPNFRSRHNSSYWQGVHYLGVGPAAHSFDGVQRRVAVESIDRYIEGGEERYEVEVLSDVDRYNEFVMTSLRCSEGVDVSRLEALFDRELVLYFRNNISRWVLEGKLVANLGRVYIPTSDFLISDSIIESLFYCEG